MLESNKESLKLEAMKRVVGVSASWGFIHILFKLLTALLCTSPLSCWIWYQRWDWWIKVLLFDFLSADCQREKCIRAVSGCCEERCEQEHRGTTLLRNMSQKIITITFVTFTTVGYDSSHFRVMQHVGTAWCCRGNFLIQNNRSLWIGFTWKLFLNLICIFRLINLFLLNVSFCTK